jgi:hypothetical protein
MITEKELSEQFSNKSFLEKKNFTSSLFAATQVRHTSPPSCMCAQRLYRASSSSSFFHAVLMS